jgi:mannitol/fructose-specific phosphotransferase system IIA component (Ntr-type)
MNLQRVIQAMKVMELTARTRSEAICAMVESVHWGELGLSAEQVIAAVEEREAAAQTIVADDLAMPHAAVDWDGDPVVILGRSRDGIEYGAAGNRIFLILLLVTSRDNAAAHVQLLAEVARLLEPADFRHAIVQADGIDDIKALLGDRTGRLSVDGEKRIREASRLSLALVEHALRMAESCQLQTLMMTLEPQTVSPGDRWLTGAGACCSPSAAPMWQSRMNGPTRT